VNEQNKQFSIIKNASDNPEKFNDFKNNNDQVRLDKANHRHLVLNKVGELMRAITIFDGNFFMLFHGTEGSNDSLTNITSNSNEDEELKIELEEMHSKGLDKNANLLEAFYYYLENTSNDDLEKKVSLILPNLINNFNLAIKEINNFRRRLMELER